MTKIRLNIAIIFLLVLVSLMLCSHIKPAAAQQLGRPTMSNSTIFANNWILKSDETNYSSGDKILVSGIISTHFENGTSLPASHLALIIEAIQNNNTIYRTSTTTDINGRFNSSFIPNQDGLVTIMTKLTNISETQNNDSEAAITVQVTKPILPSILLVVLIFGTVAMLLFLSPKYQKLSIFGSLILIGIGYIVIYKYPPLDSAGNLAIGGALLAPLAIYVIDLLKKRDEKFASVESSVRSYREEKIKNEIQSLVKIHEEITQHESVFRALHDNKNTKLSKAAYNDANVAKVGTMANLPGLYINRYYYYIDYYNSFLEDREYLEQAAPDPVYQDFNQQFQDFKKIYSKLNQVMFVNLLFNEGEIMTRFMSFPSVEFPIRMSPLVLVRLFRAGVISGEHLFRWEQVPGNDEAPLKHFLSRRFGYHWVERDGTQVQKVDNNIIRISRDNSVLSIELAQSRISAMLKDDRRTHTFAAETKDGTNIVYELEVANNKIYTRENALKLMGVLGFEFENLYFDLQQSVRQLIDFHDAL